MLLIGIDRRRHRRRDRVLPDPVALPARATSSSYQLFGITARGSRVNTMRGGRLHAAHALSLRSQARQPDAAEHPSGNARVEGGSPAAKCGFTFDGDHARHLVPRRRVPGSGDLVAAARRGVRRARGGARLRGVSTEIERELWGSGDAEGSGELSRLRRADSGARRALARPDQSRGRAGERRARAARRRTRRSGSQPPATRSPRASTTTSSRSTSSRPAPARART